MVLRISHKAMVHSMQQVSGGKNLFTFHVRRSQGEMYIGHGCLCVCPSVPTLEYGSGFNLGEW